MFLKNRCGGLFFFCFLPFNSNRLAALCCWSEVSELPHTAGQLFNQVLVCKFHSANGRSWKRCRLYRSISSDLVTDSTRDVLSPVHYMRAAGSKATARKSGPGYQSNLLTHSLPIYAATARLGLSIMQQGEGERERNAVCKAVLTFSRRRREMRTDPSTKDECLSTPKQGNWISVGYSSTILAGYLRR